MLAACASVVYITPASGSGDVLPVKAGRIVDAAQTTATDQRARATSTAARASILESIADAQTLSTLAAAQT